MSEIGTALDKAGPQKVEWTGERMTVNQVEEAFREYQDLQRRLDKLMPDQILEIGTGKNKQRFRKKGYWRAVKKWARLDVQIILEERIEMGDDWGYLITVRVIDPSGQSEDGDGSCMASEKHVYQKDWEGYERSGKKGRPRYKLDRDGKPLLDEVKTAENATIHNVRAHAITRAKNRAIADLVGFGEVSAEEINPHKYQLHKPNREKTTEYNNQSNHQRKHNGKTLPDWAKPLAEKIRQKHGETEGRSIWSHGLKSIGITDLARATEQQQHQFRDYVDFETSEPDTDTDRGDAFEPPDEPNGAV